MPEYLDQMYLDYEQSFQEFKQLITTDYEPDEYPPAYAQYQTFGVEFPGALIRKPQYENCRFIETKFISSDGSLSRFHECKFMDCILNNCDLRYCDIFESDFISDKGKAPISSCNFSYGNFINANFFDINFDGCSFRQMQIENTTFKNCIMQNSSIEQSSIKNCTFENINFKKVGVRYCTFENVEFEKVTFHILDLAKNYGLIRQLQKKPRSVRIAYANDLEMSLDDAIARLRKLIPYYLETNQFYELLNLYDFFDEHDAIFKVLPHAFKSVITACDFAALQDLCALIVKFKICSEQQLRKFYTMIRQLVIPENFPNYLKKIYNTYIENIKHILVDNPNDYPQAHIILKTDIETLGDVDMPLLLESIESNMQELAPEIDCSIQLTHHSPYDVIIVLCGLLPDILNVCQVFYYTLGGTKALADIKNSLKERTDNHTNKLTPKKDEQNIKSAEHIELSVGKIFTFKMDKEYTKRVKSMEYTIH